jgi:hypothetical protein
MSDILQQAIIYSQQKKDIEFLKRYVESLELKQITGDIQKRDFFIYKYGFCQECASNNIDFANIYDYNHVAKMCHDCGHVEYRKDMHRTIRYLKDKYLI